MGSGLWDEALGIVKGQPTLYGETVKDGPPVWLVANSLLLFGVVGKVVLGGD